MRLNSLCAILILLVTGATTSADSVTVSVKEDHTWERSYVVAIGGFRLEHVIVLAHPGTEQRCHWLSVSVETVDGLTGVCTVPQPRKVTITGVVLLARELTETRFRDASGCLWQLDPESGEPVVPGGKEISMRGTITWEENGSFYLFQEGKPSGRTWRRVTVPEKKEFVFEKQ